MTWAYKKCIVKFFCISVVTEEWHVATVVAIYSWLYGVHLSLWIFLNGVIHQSPLSLHQYRNFWLAPMKKVQVDRVGIECPERRFLSLVGRLRRSNKWACVRIVSGLGRQHRIVCGLKKRHLPGLRWSLTSMRNFRMPWSFGVSWMEGQWWSVGWGLFRWPMRLVMITFIVWTVKSAQDDFYL